MKKYFPRNTITIIKKTNVFSICCKFFKVTEENGMPLNLSAYWSYLIEWNSFSYKFSWTIFIRDLSKSHQKCFKKPKKIVDQICSVCFLLGHLTHIYNVIRVYFYLPYKLLCKISRTFMSIFQNLCISYIFF